MTFWAGDWLRMFALTLATELAVAVPLLRAVESSRRRRIVVVTIANLVTHPLVWFLFPGLALARWTRWALSETWAVLGETVVYATVWPPLRLRRALLVSLAANSVSVGAGLILTRITGGR